MAIWSDGVIMMAAWNEYRKLRYSIEEIQNAMKIAREMGGMGWPTIKDVYDRMENNQMESIGRFQLSGSELDCIEKALYFIHTNEE